MTTIQQKKEKRTRRHARIRASISGTAARPRLSVFKSNLYISAQIIDDIAGKTLAAATSRGDKASKNGIERAKAVGKALAAKAKAVKIEAIVFDRGGFIFAGQVKALAEGAREAGLKF